MVDLDDYVTTTEAAQLTGKAVSMLARLCQTGKLPGAKKMGKTWIIPRESLVNYKPKRGRPKTKEERLAAEKAALLSEVEKAKE